MRHPSEVSAIRCVDQLRHFYDDAATLAPESSVRGIRPILSLAERGLPSCYSGLLPEPH